MTPQSATSEIVPVILAGGAGTRLWPLSTERYPKQFLRLTGDTSLLQQTLARLGPLHCQAPIVVCNDEHHFIVGDQCRYCGIATGGVVLEPAPRNTAPAAAMVAIRATAAGADPVLFVLPADHYIADDTAFATAVTRGAPFARRGSIVVFGIHPRHPATGYGYIRAVAGTNGGGVAKVAAFAEKPGRTRAEEYLAEGGWYWNSGMFLLRASVYLDELKTHRPDILKACRAAVDKASTDGRVYRAGDAFLRCPSESIDRAVMEKTQRGIVVPVDMGWSDVGTWDSLAEVLPFVKSPPRPWGRAETLRSRDGFRLTRLTILPGKAHFPDVYEQGAYWAVVRGVAEVVSHGQQLALPAGEATHVPSGIRPRLNNAGEEDLVIVELRRYRRFYKNGVDPFDDF